MKQSEKTMDEIFAVSSKLLDIADQCSRDLRTVLQHSLMWKPEEDAWAYRDGSPADQAVQDIANKYFPKDG